MTKGELVMQLREIGYYYPKRTGLFSTDKFWALQAVSLSLHKGESLGIIGRTVRVSPPCCGSWPV